MLGRRVLGGRPGGAQVRSQRHRCRRLSPLGTLQPASPCFTCSRGSSRAGPCAQPSGCHLSIVFPFAAGFIDFIVEPTFSVLTDVAEKSMQPLVDEDSKSKNQPR